MSDNAKMQILSAVNTFLTTFVISAGVVLSGGPIIWSGAFWLALIATALRSGIKAVINTFVPVRLGGRM